MPSSPVPGRTSVFAGALAVLLGLVASSACSACSASAPETGTGAESSLSPGDRTDGGPAASSCVRNHDRCVEDADCCSAFCMEYGGGSFCQARDAECVEASGVCNEDRDCCGRPCTNHRCDGDVCAPLHGRCSGTGRPCCEGTCVVASEGTRTCEVLDLAVDAGGAGDAPPFVSPGPGPFVSDL